ncbi:unnamed protein product [Zymoseptoria tritici ST99CH_1A5]|uniref:Uncharacterized protein n=1 Tax=Zymoseptoria tritici ST99CH_1A5 TaxID=1276529 RepID=A0A1Y6LZQ3_ZYMTR|nr:unnamed protein product [Zymoseptoria tritici ST99CH_1A5]
MSTSAAVPYSSLNAAAYLHHTKPTRTSSTPQTPRLAVLSGSPANVEAICKLGPLFQRRSMLGSEMWLQAPWRSCRTSMVRPLPYRVQYEQPDVELRVLEQEIEYDPADLRLSGPIAEGPLGATRPDDRAAYTQTWLRKTNVQQPERAALYPPYRTQVHLRHFPAYFMGDEETDGGASQTEIVVVQRKSRFERRQNMKLAVFLVAIVFSVCLLCGLAAGIAATT